MADFSDFVKSAQGILTSIAPTVATALGGPFAGVATQKLITALGLAPDAPQDQIMQAVAAATPEQLLKLKEAEQAFIIECRKLEIDVMRLQAGDRDSARKREVSAGDSWTPRILAGIIVSLYVVVQYYILNHVIDPSMKEVVMRSLGTLDASVGMILGYYFGSSIGSTNKNHQITTLIGDKSPKEEK